jgi:hypothetical protein
MNRAKMAKIMAIISVKIRINKLEIDKKESLSNLNSRPKWSVVFFKLTYLTYYCKIIR